MTGNFGGVPPANLAAASSLPPQQIAKTWRAAQDFEAMTLGQLLQPMFDANDQSNGLFGGGSGEEAWRPMLVNEMARKISSAGGLGLAGPIFAQMLRAQETSLNNPGKTRSIP